MLAQISQMYNGSNNEFKLFGVNGWVDFYLPCSTKKVLEFTLPHPLALDVFFAEDIPKWRLGGMR